MLDIREERLASHFLKHHIDLGDGAFVILHTFNAPDLGDPHDHPWNFTSMVVKGSYIEEIFDLDGRSETVLRKTGDHFDVPANRVHRIIDLPEGECRTMVLYGAPVQKPGFYRFEDGKTLHRFHDEAEFKLIGQGNQAFSVLLNDRKLPLDSARYCRLDSSA